MIEGLGSDVIEVSRVERELRKEGKPAFRDNLFTADEIRYCEGKSRRAQHYAARFAAKEAFFKALGTGQRDGLRWIDVEVVHDPHGRPGLKVSGRARALIEERAITNILVSLSHVKATASAVVVLESRESR